MNKQAQPRPEVVELERLIDDAEKSSPQLWAAIQKSISIAELACYSMQTQGECRSAIIQGTETSTLFPRQELA